MRYLFAVFFYFLLTSINAVGQIAGTTSVCEGSVTVLTCTTPTGGTWSSSSTGVASVDGSGTVVGVAAGTSIISYVSLPTIHTVIVTVHPTPSPITSSSFRICAGNNVSFSSVTSGGTWLSVNTSIATVGAFTGLVTGVASGITTIKYVMPATGCEAVANVTVNPAPASIVGSAAVCTGNTISLSHITSGGVWSSTNIAVATVSGSGFVSGISAGTASISYFLPSGCYTVRSVTVNATPTSISGATTVCSGSFSSLLSSPAGGSWSAIGSAATIHPITGVVSAVSAGTAHITYVIPSSGCFTTTIISVNPTPGPITGTTAICHGSSATLSNSIAGGTWSSDATGVVSVSAATGSSISITGVSVGTATISYVIGTSCLASVIVTVHPLTVPGIISGGGTPLCVGNTTFLSGSVSGGTWVSASPSIASVGVVSGLVTSLSAGTTLISYVVGGFCGTVYTTSVFTVSSTPTAISGSATICLGANSLYTNGITGGTWSSSDATVASVGASTGLVSGINAGSARITYVLSSGCSATQMVSVSPAPSVITGASVVCAGSTENLINAVSGGIWTTGSPTVATVAVGGGVTGVVLGLSAGTSIITYSIGSCFATHVMTVVPLPAIIANAYPVACGAAYTTLATGADTYLWSPSTGLSCDDCPNPTCTPSATTSYTVTGTSVSGCSNITIVSIPGNRINGHVTFIPFTPSVTDLKVWLIQYNPADSAIISIDSTLTCLDGTQPYYQFSGKPNGNYYVKAKLLSSTSGTNIFIPTYGSSTPHWSFATTVSHAGNTTTQDIGVQYATVPIGPGAISGFVYSGAGKGTAGDAPVAGLLVYLKSAVSGSVVAYAYTDTLGAYQFSGLGFGNYIVYPEEYGYYTTPSTLVELIAASYLKSNISFRKSTTFNTIYPYVYSGVRDVADADGHYVIYPNPAGEEVFIMRGNESATTIIISDITGKVEMKERIIISAGAPYKLDISSLSSGLHIVTIISGDSSQTQRLMVTSHK
jgi:uncharacterized protein YjdB